MRNLRTKLLCILLVVLVFPVVGLSAQNQPTLNIAILADSRHPLTDGARLAVRQINDAGGIQIDAQTSVLLDLLPVAATALDNPEGMVQVLRSQDVIAVIGPTSDDQTARLIPTLVELGVPILTPTTSDTLLTSDTSGLVFRILPSDIVQGQALAAFLIEEFGFDEIATAQLDIASTARMLAFATASSVLGIAPMPAVFFTDESELPPHVDQVVAADPEAIVVYGAVPPVAGFYSALREAGWDGMFIYPNAENLAAALPIDEIEGVIGMTTWTYTFTDPLSVSFTNLYVRTYGDIPNALAAAGYDAIRLIEAALALPNDLRANLLAVTSTRGTQGILDPSALSNGETNDNVAITRLNEFGAPEVIANYRGSEPVEPEAVITLAPPTPTPRPEGTFITITSERQNVRMGPSMDYPILGQLVRGDTATVVGRSIDSEWVVIEFLGDPGWLAVDLLLLTGSLADIPVIAPPTTPVPPTAAVSPTPTAGAAADVIIQSAVVTPNPIIAGQTFTITVTVANIGLATTGQFTVAGTLAPSNLFLSGIIPALAPGQTLPVNLTGIFNNTGVYTSSLIVDANNQVNEGVVGEQNNIYNLTYTIDRRVLRQASQILNLGDTLDLEGNAAQGDVNWNADGTLALDALFGARIGIISGLDLNAITYDSINPANLTRDTIPRAEVFPGNLIGIVTADGNRGVMRVDAISDTQITLTFKVYSNA